MGTFTASRKISLRLQVVLPRYICLVSLLLPPILPDRRRSSISDSLIWQLPGPPHKRSSLLHRHPEKWPLVRVGRASERSPAANPSLDRAASSPRTTTVLSSISLAERYLSSQRAREDKTILIVQFGEKCQTFFEKCRQSCQIMLGIKTYLR